MTFISPDILLARATKSDLPDPTGKTGKVLTSNGTTASWEDSSAGSPPTGTGHGFYIKGHWNAGASKVDVIGAHPW